MYDKKETIMLRNMSGAFLHKDGKYLLMKRTTDKKLAAGAWSLIGGHMETEEINDPLAACLREVYEETGIEERDILDIELRYIIIRIRKNEIRQSYVYFGETSAVVEERNTDEGELHWVETSDLSGKVFTNTYAEMIKHYLTIGKHDKNIYVGVAESRAGLYMNWSVLQDFE